MIYLLIIYKKTPNIIFPELSNLNLSFNRELTDIPKLTKIPKLEVLNLHYTNLRTLPSLDKLQMLEVLILADSGLKELPNLNNKNLKVLDLRETDIKSLPSLSNLESMRTIYIESSIDFSNLELYNFILSITDHAITQEKIDRLIARYGENNIVIDDEHDEIRVTVLL